MSAKPEPQVIVVRTWGDQIVEEAVGREAMKEHVRSVWRITRVMRIIFPIIILLIFGFVVCFFITLRTRTTQP